MWKRLVFVENQRLFVGFSESEVKTLRWDTMPSFTSADHGEGVCCKRGRDKNICSFSLNNGGLLLAHEFLEVL